MIDLLREPLSSLVHFLLLLKISVMKYHLHCVRREREKAQREKKGEIDREMDRVRN